MNAWRALWVWSAVWSVVATGCSYPEFAFAAGDATPADATPTDATVGARDGTADSAVLVVPDEGVDAGRSETEADTSIVDATVDTSVDTSVADATIADVADARDARDARDSAPDTYSPGCVGDGSVFCLDFDDWTSATTGFTGTNIGTGGAVALEASGRSLPNAFASTVQAGDGGTVVVGNAYRSFVVPTAGTTMRVDAWIRLESAVFPNGQVFLFKLQHVGGDGVALSVDKNGFYVEVVGEPYAEYRVATPVPINRWFHARLEAKMLIAGGSTTLWIDDMGAGAFSKAAFSTARSDDVSRRLIVGLYAADHTTWFRAYYDDVSLRFVP